MNSLNRQVANPRPRKNNSNLKNTKHQILPKIAALFRAQNKSLWWEETPIRISGSTHCSWTDILQRDGFRCIYCGTDLSASARTLTTVTLDHIVPQSLFVNPSAANRVSNLASCCPACNALKGDWYPNIDHAKSWLSRAGYLEAARRRIEARLRGIEAKHSSLIGAASR